ncbi:hypothetical protein FRAHR75_530010 [Frankia sp. Hr75.2]|nr:hypothetical protein FRAHR75_530010 [Frankia sp. Hr75.2]SQD96310.1 hypothetical protein FMEAI12_3580005 [Parafrankia sp. Ea1.12]
MSLVVRLYDVRRDTAPVTHRVAVAARPLANVGGAVGSTGTPRSGPRPATATGRPATGTAGSGDERRQRLPQLGGVLLRQVDLILCAVQSEPDRLVGLFSAEIVNQRDDGLLSHATLLQVSGPQKLTGLVLPREDGELSRLVRRTREATATMAQVPSVLVGSWWGVDRTQRSGSTST